MKFLPTLLIIVSCLVIISSVVVTAAAANNNNNMYSSNQPEQPIIGILSQPNPHSWAATCGEYIQTTYVDWLAASGARTVAIHYDTPRDQLMQQLSQINGALFTGGGLNFKEHVTFYNTAKTIYDYAVSTAQNTPDNKFVLWGTCQGFQLISVIAAGSDFDVLHCDYHGVDNAMLPLDMTDKANSSRFFSLVNQSAPSLWDDYTKKNSTANAHGCGVSPSTYASNANLAASMDVLSTNVDVNNKPFASTIEHKFAEIYAAQNHYEIPMFWYISNINHKPSTLEVSAYGGKFLASRLRMNNHSFPSLPLDPLSGEPDYKNSNNWLTTMINQFPIVENDPMGFAGFYCVGGYNAPASATEQQLRDQLASLTASKRDLSDTLIAVCVLFIIILLSLIYYTYWKAKQDRRDALLGGTGGGYGNTQA